MGDKTYVRLPNRPSILSTSFGLVHSDVRERIQTNDNEKFQSAVPNTVISSFFYQNMTLSKDLPNISTPVAVGSGADSQHDLR